MVKAKIIDFKEELDWIAHIGSLEGLSIESIIQIYINSGSSLDTIKEEVGEDLTKRIEDKIVTAIKVGNDRQGRQYIVVKR